MRGLATADQLALAACRALMRAALIVDDEHAKRALVLARAAVALTSQTP